MTSIHDTYGDSARKDLKTQYDTGYITQDIKWGERDIRDIQQFVREAKAQLAVIETTTFKRYIDVRKGHDYHLGKVEFSISVYRVPQVPGNDCLKVYEHDDSRRFVGNDKRKEFIAYAQERMAKYPDAEVIGNAAQMCCKPVKGVLQI